MYELQVIKGLCLAEPLAAPQLVKASVVHEPIEPAQRLFCFCEGRAKAQQLEKGLLQRVFRKGVVSQERQAPALQEKAVVPVDLTDLRLREAFLGSQGRVQGQPAGAVVPGMLQAEFRQFMTSPLQRPSEYVTHSE